MADVGNAAGPFLIGLLFSGLLEVGPGRDGIGLGPPAQDRCIVCDSSTGIHERLGFDCTNNMTEYEACAMGITMAIEHQISRLKVFSGSALETRDAKLVPYHAHIMALREHFEEISFHYVPRDKNQMVDALTTLSAMLQANRRPRKR
ncbi:hypothetical protein CR513_35673, partial [Mucuna pruriens]